MQTDDFLNEIEIEQVKLFNGNVVQREAIRKILLASVYANGVLKPGEKANPLRNAALGLLLGQNGLRPVTNEKLGEELRGMAEGVLAIEEGFNKLSKYSEEVVKAKEEENPAV